MSWFDIFGLYGDATVVTSIASVASNDYTHRASNIFKSSDPPKADELKAVIAMYSPDAGISGTAAPMRGNNLLGFKSPGQRNNIAILLALLIQQLVNSGTYSNILQYLNTALASGSTVANSSTTQLAQPAVAPMVATNDDLLVVLFKMAQLKYSSMEFKTIISIN